jgi:hypothetical protein
MMWPLSAHKPPYPVTEGLPGLATVSGARDHRLGRVGAAIDQDPSSRVDQTTSSGRLPQLPLRLAKVRAVGRPLGCHQLETRVFG